MPYWPMSFAFTSRRRTFIGTCSGPHFRDYHLLLGEHGDQLFSMTDVIAECVRKLGGTTSRSIGHIARLQRLPDNDAEFVGPDTMLNRLEENERQLVLSMKALHSQCDNAADLATASLLDNWIDESERRHWFLFESTRQ
jgi:starvation-inducible DNA-binding protein